MKSDLMTKLSASFFVLVMALSTLVVLPASVEGQAPETNDIFVPVRGQGSAAVPSAIVTLTNVHSGDSIRATPSSGIFFKATEPPSGFYRLDVTAGGYYDYLNAQFFPFDALQSYVTNAVQLEPFPSKDYRWNVTVLTSNPVKTGITVGFYHAERKQVVASDTTDVFGFADFKMFNTSGRGTYYLFAQAAGKETYVQETIVTGNSTATISLTDSKVVSGIVRSDTGLALNVVAYLLNQDPSIPWIKRLMKSPTQDGSFLFDAYSGTYTLSVSADGLMSNVTTLSVGGNTFPDMKLPTQTPREESVSIVYDENYRSFNLSLTTAWAYDEPFPGLQYSDVGSLRMQIDLNNNSDGTVDALEDWNFRQNPVSGLLKLGPQNVTTPWLLVLNKTETSPGLFYIADDNLADFSLGSTQGDVTSTTSVSYFYRAAYTVYVPTGATVPPLTSPEYSLSMNVHHDTPFVNHTYRVQLMTEFEVVANDTSDPEGTFVGGYGLPLKPLVVDPGSGSGAVSVDLTIEKAQGPIAKAGMDNYVETNATGAILRYIVGVGKNATFTANDSSDPNNNPLTYTWEFGDGTSETTKNKTLVHVYSTPSALRLANLTVTDVAGLTNRTSVNVTCDGLDPFANITLNMKNKTLVGGKLYMKQHETVIVNANGSYDDAAIAGDEKGLIDHVQFVWGDGNVSGRIMRNDDEQNATWSYERAGTYTMWLNVTDVVGRHTNKSLTVQVNDSSGPTVQFNVKNASWGTTLVEQQPLWFMAQATRDNVDNYTLMHYSWSFGDAIYSNGTGLVNVTHTYSALGSYTVSLNVTDLSGNYKLDPKVITVVSKPRPNLRIDNVTYLPSTFTEGKAGTIVVNITNVGNAVAKNITISFYIQDLDGTERLIGTETVNIYNGTTLVIEVKPGGKIRVEFAYSPGSKGAYTIKVTANSTDQLTASEKVESGSNALEVKEAAWKKYALWGGVLGVIVLVPLLIYLTRRWSRRERKGPRREKKSEEQ